MHTRSYEFKSSINRANYEINYIHKQLKHPTSIVKQLPLSVENCLGKLSSNKKIINDSLFIYQEALIKADYIYKFKCQEHDQKKRKVTTTQKANYLV